LSALSQRRISGSSEEQLNTLGTLLLALQLQGGDAPVPGSTSVIDLVMRTGPVNQSVLALLGILSIVSWAIILHKSLTYYSAGRHTLAFLDAFRKSSKFSEVQAVCATIPHSPLVGVFQAGYAEINAQLRVTTPAGAGNPAAAAARPILKSLAAVDRALLRASAVEVNKLEKKVTFLATIASASPFIGLFGTVWGIMTSFRAIAGQQTTSLAVVAPGIAEALFATAIGLVAAIPATIFYNKFISDVNKQAQRLEGFADEFAAILSRQIDERG